MEAQNLFSMRNEFIKISLTRADKEIARGTITPEEYGGRLGVDAESLRFPGLKEENRTHFQRTRLRSRAIAPAEQSPEALARTRQLNKMRYEAHMKVDPLATKEPLRGGIAATIPTTGFVHAPETGGQFVRAIGDMHRGGPMGRAVNTAKLLAYAQFPNETTEKLLPARAPMDDTLTHSVMRHELGERAASKEAPVGFSSHIGVKPILEENIGNLHDPEAQAAMATVRRNNPEDARIQKLIRQAGGTPDAPMPIGGKQEEAVKRMLTKQVQQDPKRLGVTSRQRNLVMPFALGHGGSPLVPPELHPSAVMPQLEKEIPAALDAVKNKQYRQAFEHGSNLMGTLRKANNYLTHGTVAPNPNPGLMERAVNAGGGLLSRAARRFLK